MPSGYLILADISGFTSYLAQVELDHAQEILAELLEAIVERFSSLLAISKLEGDAVFAYSPMPTLQRGETLLELLESTYVTFRDQVEATRRRTTCDCRACRAIPKLDLKFFIHYGEYAIQRVSGSQELVGSDVNLVHRLMKNSVGEATGWTAYALFTATGMEHLGLRLEGLHEQTESYEHLGEVHTHSLNLRPRYEALVAERRDIVTPEQADVVSICDYPMPPPVVWEWLNDPHKRALYSSEEPFTFIPALLPGGRTGVGARTHCIHGKKLVMVETVLDWRPFDYFTVTQVIKPLTIRATFTLTPIAEGTRLHVYERGRLTSIEVLDRPIIRFLFTKVHPSQKVLDRMADSIRKELVHNQSAEAEAAPA